MKIFMATDSFKGSLTSSEAGAAVKEAAYCVCPNWEADTYCSRTEESVTSTRFLRA